MSGAAAMPTPTMPLRRASAIGTTTIAARVIEIARSSARCSGPRACERPAIAGLVAGPAAVGAIDMVVLPVSGPVLRDARSGLVEHVFRHHRPAKPRVGAFGEHPPLVFELRCHSVHLQARPRLHGRHRLVVLLAARLADPVAGLCGD